MSLPVPPPGAIPQAPLEMLREGLANPAALGEYARGQARSTGRLPLTNSTPNAQATPSAQSVPRGVSVDQVVLNGYETAKYTYAAISQIPAPMPDDPRYHTQGFFDEVMFQADLDSYKETRNAAEDNLAVLGKLAEGARSGGGSGGGGGGGGSAGYVYDPNVAINAINQFNQFLNELDLTEYQINFERTQAENDRLLDDFRAKLDKFAGKVTFDQLNLSRNQQELSRFAETRSENRQRADDVQSAIQAVLPYVGKEQYTSRELGASFETLARIAGQDPDAPIRVGTGTAHINPLALLGALDTRTGTAGAPPVVPGLATKIGDIPNAPTLGSFPEPPFPLRRPDAPYTGPPMIIGATGGGGVFLPNGVQIQDGGTGKMGQVPSDKGAAANTSPSKLTPDLARSVVDSVLGRGGSSSQPAGSPAPAPLPGYLDTVAGPPAPGPMGPPLPPQFASYPAGAAPGTYRWDGQRWVLN